MKFDKNQTVVSIARIKTVTIRPWCLPKSSKRFISMGLQNRIVARQNPLILP